MRKCKKIFTALIAIFFLFAVIFSLSFIALNADHDCAEASCIVCSQIETCENILETTGLCAAIAVVTCAAAGYKKYELPEYEDGEANSTLISLKVKLSI